MGRGTAALAADVLLCGRLVQGPASNGNKGANDAVVAIIFATGIFAINWLSRLLIGIDDAPTPAARASVRTPGWRALKH